jgi:hypothetical protein
MIRRNVFKPRKQYILSAVGGFRTRDLRNGSSDRWLYTVSSDRGLEIMNYILNLVAIHNMMYKLPRGLYLNYAWKIMENRRRLIEAIRLIACYRHYHVYNFFSASFFCSEDRTDLWKHTYTTIMFHTIFDTQSLSDCFDRKLSWREKAWSQ